MGVGELSSSDTQGLEMAELRFSRHLRFHRGLSEEIGTSGAIPRVEETWEPIKEAILDGHRYICEESFGGRDHLIRRLHDVDEAKHLEVS